MLRHIQCMLLFVFLAGPVVAQDNDPTPEMSRDDLREAIYASDYAFVENALSDIQAAVLQGEFDRNYPRRMFEVFDTNNPKIENFVDGWLKAYPKSPYAHTARALNYNITAWNIRGEDIARKTYSGALAEFQAMQDKALEHAEQAYKTDDRLLPASDMLLGLANSTGTKRGAYKILHDVMRDDPNMGTLRRALHMTVPGWGGSWEKAEELCDFYGPMIDWKETDPVLYCKVFAAGTYHSTEKGDWVRDILAQGEVPTLDFLRMHWATHHTATRAEAEFARAYLNREGVTDVDFARKFDEGIAYTYDFDFVGEAHLRRAQANARKSFVHDPYNPALIKILKTWVSTTTRTETGVIVKTAERPTREEETEYARRLLVASPYNPSYWKDYARLRFKRTPEFFLKDEPYHINAIVYSNHSPGLLNEYVFAKWQLLDGLQRLDTDPQSKMWQKLDDNRRAKAEKVRQKWLALRARINLDRDIRCPMMRAYRLLDLICETSQDPDCDPSTRQLEMFELIQADVNKRRVCTGEMTSPAYELFFTPVPVDLSAPKD